MTSAICLGLLVACVVMPQAFAADEAAQRSNQSDSSPAYQGVAVRSDSKSQIAAAHRPKPPNFKQESASPNARHLAGWIIDSGDNRGMPFVIVDKSDAKVFLFTAGGQLRGAAPVLLGLALGDTSVPGIGDRKLSSIRPEERTTPAGRFVAALGHNLSGEEILWVDYDRAISLHRVITTNPKEHRAQRLATPSPLDNRISYGCINVPADFYKTVVRKTFAGTAGITYILPEVASIDQIFAMHDAAGLTGAAP
jgi:hypothetical protein